MADKSRHDPGRRTRRKDEPVKIPLDFERALGGILAAGPHPNDGEVEQDAEAAPKRRRTSRKVKPSEDGVMDRTEATCRTMGARALPNDLIAEILDAEDAIEFDLDVVRGVRITVVVETAGWG